MAASFVASFIAFLVTGLYTMSRSNLEAPIQIKAWVFAVLLANALYYYYLAAYSEMDAGFQAKLVGQPRLEWFLRVASQTLLFSLWFLLQLGWTWFGAGLVGVYLLCMCWDILLWKVMPDKFLFLLDFLGLLFGAVFLFQLSGVKNAEPEHLDPMLYFRFGMTVVAYAVIIGLGCWHLKDKYKFLPWAATYRARPVLR